MLNAVKNSKKKANHVCEPTKKKQTNSGFNF